ncbi:iron-sulfur cluster repair di-iron protein [Flavobacterium branchiicola]|uniref:Iron-sulfur cluster repair di-iron protein n=1 Tax=Flavobacterium branchiicola TaxID=1114875 RepID=A0ABV9PB14_9FLAO|nr:iron-sulfur cluster repair di-iron protein [Flavobacterium branchiicola]MBS7253564.1 iron-sulfur cluster repair di-iron protein [Flavobacterium branchiicola]
MKITSKTTIGEIVADDFRTAVIFTKYHIDFCCKGHRTIEEVCKKRDIDEAILIKHIETAKNGTENQSFDYKSWSVDLLTDYIIKTHHRYIKEKTPVLEEYLNKLCTVHGDNHPELYEIKALFLDAASDLDTHMDKEERTMFPFIIQMKRAHSKGLFLETPPFGSLENQVLMMKEEHNAEGQRFKRIATLSNNYTPPTDSCATYKVTFGMLDEFEKNLHKHIHMENNILFPKAISLEKNVEHVS